MLEKHYLVEGKKRHAKYFYNLVESQFTFRERDVNSARFRKYISYFPYNTGGCHSPYFLPKPIVYPPGILFVSSVSQVPKGKNKVVIPLSTNFQFIFAVLQFFPPTSFPGYFAFIFCRMPDVKTKCPGTRLVLPRK